jgi:hypothetical protein
MNWTQVVAGWAIVNLLALWVAVRLGQRRDTEPGGPWQS